MIDFKSITPEDKPLLDAYLLSGDRRDNNLSVVNLCSWQFLTCSSYAVLRGTLVLRFCFQEYDAVYSLVSQEDPAVVRLLAEQAKEEKTPLYLYGIVPEMQKWLEEIFPGVFEYRSDRDHFDYLYLRKDLAELKGKDYQAKRNHVNRFRKTYDFRYTPLTTGMVEDCLKMYDEWCMARRCGEDESLSHERQALVWALQHFEALDLQGGALWVEGRIIAFTFGAPVNRDTFCIHAEKALMQYEGAYNAINQEFASRLPEQYIYLNREEDLGVPGLRKAKLSYHPVQLLEKGIAVCAAGVWDRVIRVEAAG